MQILVVLLVLAMLAPLGCASSNRSATAAPPAQPAPRGLADGIRRIAIVAYGESRFTAVEPSAEPGRTFDQILTGNPYGQTLRPIFTLLHQGINWLLELDDAAAARAHVAGVLPRAMVAESLAHALRASGRFEDVRAYDREPIGEERRRLDAIVRVSVPTWGLVRVRAGEPPLVSAFADVNGQMVRRGSGVVVWEEREDVIAADRVPVESLTRDPGFARQELVDVLARAGRRLASEILYAGAGAL